MVGDAISFVNQAQDCDSRTVGEMMGDGAERSHTELMLATDLFLRHDPPRSLLLSRINGDAPQASKY